jgi:hypothetical protein
MTKPATNSKAQLGQSYKPPARDYDEIRFKSAAEIDPDFSLYDVIFDGVQLLLFEKGRSREEIFNIIQDNCFGMPVSDQEIGGIIDLICVGMEL